MFQNTKSIVLKMTEQCNLSCSYCYVKDRAKETMSVETLTDLMHRFLSESKYGDINIVFHGGEPTIVSHKLFATFLKIIYALGREYGKENITCFLQTNGYELNKNWINLINRYRIQCSVSFDGFYDRNQLRSNTGPVITNILALHEKEFLSTVLFTLHKKNYKDIIKDINILYGLGIKKVKVNRLYSETEQIGWKDWLLVSQDICKMMWMKNDFMDDSLFEMMRKYYNKEEPIEDIREAMCDAMFCGAGKSTIEINPLGEVYFCNQTRNDPETIYTKDVLELRNIVNQLEYFQPKLDVINEKNCSFCSARKICSGDCMSFKTDKMDFDLCKYFRGLNQFFIDNNDTVAAYIERHREMR